MVNSFQSVVSDWVATMNHLYCCHRPSNEQALSEAKARGIIGGPTFKDVAKIAMNPFSAYRQIEELQNTTRALKLEQQALDIVIQNGLPNTVRIQQDFSKAYVQRLFNEHYNSKLFPPRVFTWDEFAAIFAWWGINKHRCKDNPHQVQPLLLRMFREVFPADCYKYGGIRPILEGNLPRLPKITKNTMYAMLNYVDEAVAELRKFAGFRDLEGLVERAMHDYMNEVVAFVVRYEAENFEVKVNLYDALFTGLWDTVDDVIDSVVPRGSEYYVLFHDGEELDREDRLVDISSLTWDCDELMLNFMSAPKPCIVRFVGANLALSYYIEDIARDWSVFDLKEEAFFRHRRNYFPAWLTRIDEYRINLPNGGAKRKREDIDQSINEARNNITNDNPFLGVLQALDQAVTADNNLMQTLIGQMNFSQVEALRNTWYNSSQNDPAKIVKEIWHLLDPEFEQIHDAEKAVATSKALILPLLEKVYIREFTATGNNHISHQRMTDLIENRYGEFAEQIRQRSIREEALRIVAEQQQAQAVNTVASSSQMDVLDNDPDL